MFIVGHNITASDIFTLAHVAEYFVCILINNLQAGLTDFEKLSFPHAFRWIDHVQHLPGLLEQVLAKGLFVSFPDENAQPPSKGELKRLAKKGGSGKPENPAQNNKEAANKGKKPEQAPKEN